MVTKLYFLPKPTAEATAVEKLAKELEANSLSFAIAEVEKRRMGPGKILGVMWEIE